MMTMQILTLLLVFFSVSLLYVTDASGSKDSRKGSSSITPKIRSIRAKKGASNSSTNSKMNRSIIGVKEEVGSSSTKPTVDYSISDNVKDFETALKIYIANGLSPTTNQETVYRVVEGGLSFITYGHAVCKHVLSRMKISSGLKSVEIIYDGLIPANYEHANEKSNDQLKLYGAKCNYGDRANDFLFVTDSKEKQHYYIFGRDLQKKSFGNQLHLKIKACLKIIINKETDFPVITNVQETSDAFIAETIYQKFHDLSGLDGRNVCPYDLPEPPENRAALICDQYRLKYKHLYKEGNVNAECRWHTIFQWIIRDIGREHLRWEQLAAHSHAAECKFKLVNSDATKQILLYNTSSKTSSGKLDHYYVAEIYPGNIWRITSVVQLIEFPDYVFPI